LSEAAAEQRLNVAGATVAADRSGALHWPDEGVLIAADLHLEKGSAYAARGQMLPPYDTQATLARLEDAVRRLRPAHVVLLGDTFHDGGAEDRLAPGDRMRLEALIAAAARWTFVLGNHDPAPPKGIGGEVAGELRIGPLTLRHEPRARPVQGEIAGHLHPAARVSVRGRSIRRRCFVTDGERLVLPAFGAYAGGLDVFDPALRDLFGRRFQALMLGERGVHAVASQRLARR
jgi:DNA ligase-associated metallophosphoesterase